MQNSLPVPVTPASRDSPLWEQCFSPGKPRATSHLQKMWFSFCAEHWPASQEHLGSNPCPSSTEITSIPATPTPLLAIPTWVKPGTSHRELKAKPPPPEPQTPLIHCTESMQGAKKPQDKHGEHRGPQADGGGQWELWDLNPFIPAYLHFADCLHCHCRS